MAKAKPKAPAAPKPAKVVAVDPANVERVLKNLGNVEKKSRPLKRKALAATIASYFQNTLSKAQVAAIIEKLVGDKKITDKSGAISYAF